MEMHTVSGDTRLYLPDNDGFILHYQRISGDVRSDFQLKTSLSDKSGTAVYLTGADRHYSMQTVSGDLRIYRRGHKNKSYLYWRKEKKEAFV